MEDPELMVLVDEDDRVIGTGEKLETHRRGALHRPFSVIIWDSAGQQLLQKMQRAIGAALLFMIT
jgi:isopentenyl-diphosphate Delta-isomerase